MPRRKQTTINLKELDTYSALIAELQNNPAYSDRDLTTLKLTVFDNYEATIKEVDKVIKHFQHYVVAKKNTIEVFQGEQLIHRVQLTKMLGISRQTLTALVKEQAERLERMKKENKEAEKLQNNLSNSR